MRSASIAARTAMNAGWRLRRFLPSRVLPGRETACLSGEAPGGQTEPPCARSSNSVRADGIQPDASRSGFPALRRQDRPFHGLAKHGLAKHGSAKHGLAYVALSLFFLCGLVAGQAHAQQTSPSSTASTTPALTTHGQFILLPIMEEAGATGTGEFSEADLQTEMTKLKQQIGENQGMYRIGFSHILRSPDALLKHCKLAKANNLSVGVIIAVQTHSGGVAPPNLVMQDFRRMQWRLDGKTWEGEPKVAKDGNPEFPARDWRVPTPSRYCAAIHDAAMGQVRAAARNAVGAMRAYPGVIVAVNASIEEELATGGESNDGLLADYSPYAVTEFRDWLRHTGKYDDLTGEYKSEGAPETLVGPFRRIKGALRSQFYDEPSPADAGNSGVSFDQWFGTNFTTWTLRSWDLDKFPAPITDRAFAPLPDEGAPGATTGGFDAPHKRRVTDRYWCAWSWDVYDHNGAYPPGNPAQPAFGFRQFEIRHFVLDVLNEARKAGVPPGLLYAHQIPSEVVSPTRNRSGASPVWTGFDAASGTLGITRFGPIEPSRLSQYSRDWGIFEWHPKPFTRPDDPGLYTATIDALNAYARAGGHIFFAGWWKAHGEQEKIFPLNDSQFARGLHDWVGARR